MSPAVSLRYRPRRVSCLTLNLYRVRMVSQGILGTLERAQMSSSSSSARVRPATSSIKPLSKRSAILIVAGSVGSAEPVLLVGWSPGGPTPAASWPLALAPCPPPVCLFGAGCSPAGSSPAGPMLADLFREGCSPEGSSPADLFRTRTGCLLAGRRLTGWIREGWLLEGWYPEGS